MHSNDLIDICKLHSYIMLYSSLEMIASYHPIPFRSGFMRSYDVSNLSMVI